jgi:N-methylhydantoinase B
MRLSAVDLELFANRLAGVAGEMGVVLQAASMSPNIKERRDFSCALFDAAGAMVAHAAHIPVHLGSTPLAVRAALDALTLGRGDIAILNDPYAGGTHLPDVTLVAPVFLARGDVRPFAFVADRAHHADIGGGSPGSMALATDIHQEGLRIPPVHLVRGGQWVRETLELFLANTRVAEERRGDLEAQVAALRAGAARTTDLAARFGRSRVAAAMRELQAYSRRLVEAMIRGFPEGTHRAGDLLDDDGMGTVDIPIRVAVSRRGRRLVFDFRDSADQVRGPLNANLAITTSAVFYAMACVAGREVPANAGVMEAVEIRTRPGSIVDCRFPSAVAGGNVETSQRLVDVVFRALASALPDRIPAASCGTMTNLALGSGGAAVRRGEAVDRGSGDAVGPRGEATKRGRDGAAEGRGEDSGAARAFSYYETVGGGCGAGPRGEGAHAMQTHMTNTWNTPVEILETYYPLRVHRYAVRRGSGGEGKHRGGDGIVREVEVLVDAEMTLLAERRRRGPWGLAGGSEGSAGRDEHVDAKGGRTPFPSKVTRTLKAGERVLVETPGGGGWGRARAKGSTARASSKTGQRRGRLTGRSVD